MEKHTGITWQSKAKAWFEHGTIADYGRGKQIFLSLKYMRKKNKKMIEDQYNKKERERSEIIQKRLF
jgi:hypothetical protein